MADCSLAGLASVLGKRDDAKRYELRSRNWRSIMDPATKFPRSRNTDGVFAGNPDPALSEGFHEGTAWQYQWLVPQDLPGLIDAIGGKDEANARLDHFFDYAELLKDPQRVTRQVWVNSAYDYYGQSRYNPQNEPDLHAPYVYLWTGQPWKTADVVRAATTLFTNGPTGMTGNDDLGAMSAWHVLSSIGIYPAQTGTDQLVIGSPKFTKVTLHLQKPWFAGDVVIDSPASSDANRYVQNVTLGGKKLRNSWFTVDQLRGGTTLSVALGSEPSSWATPDTVPPSPCHSPGQGELSNLSLSLTATGSSSLPTSNADQHVAVRADLVTQAKGTVHADVVSTVKAPLSVTPSRTSVTMSSHGDPATASVPLDVVIPAGAPAGPYPVTVTASSKAGDVTKTLMLTLVDAGCANPGSACPLDITSSLNLDGVATPETKTEGNFDGVGWSFPAGQLPAPGVAILGATAYRIPSTAGTAPNFVAPTAAVTVPAAGKFSQLSLLASARNGDARDVPVTLHYANGDVATRISASDWAAGSPRFGETDLVPTTGRVAMNSPSGTDGLPVHLWGITVPTDPARTLVSVTFGSSAQLAVMSISGLTLCSGVAARRGARGHGEAVRLAEAG